MTTMTENKTETFEGVDPGNVHEGDRLQFITRDTGFNGSSLHSRTGTVIKVTEKTVRVACDAVGQAKPEIAILRRSVPEWVSRDVRRVITERPARRPFNAENVQYVDEGVIVTAVWVSDPTVDPAIALENILHSDLPYEVEVVAEATRFYKKEGADFSGWIVRSGLDYTDSVPNKREAMTQMRFSVQDYFAR